LESGYGALLERDKELPLSSGKGMLTSQSLRNDPQIHDSKKHRGFST
jgi:hypothetical protein